METPLHPPLAPVKARGSRRRRKPENLPEEIEQALIKFGERLRTEVASCFASNPRLKRRVAQLLASQLPPYPGRPVKFPEVRAADRMFEELRGKHHVGNYRRRDRAIWRQIYPVCIEGYHSLPPAARRAAEEELRNRVRWRRRARRRRYKSGKNQS